MITEALPYPDNLDSAVADIADMVRRECDEQVVTALVAQRLSQLLDAGLELPAEMVAPDPERYVMRPLHVASDGSFSIACAVWDVEQGTPVHGHETWGVVGIYAGIEHEVRFRKPDTDNQPLEALPPQDWHPGQVTVCCTTDDDVHQVQCGGPQPCVGIHVYGADIGTRPRRAYDPATGNVRWFVSTWA